MKNQWLNASEIESSESFISETSRSSPQKNVFFPKKTTFFLIIEAIMIRLFALWPVLGADAIEIFTVSEKKLDFLQASTFCNSKNAKLLSPKLLPDVRSENNIIVISFHKN